MYEQLESQEMLDVALEDLLVHIGYMVSDSKTTGVIRST